MYITRKEAVGILSAFIGTGILDEELEDGLEEIRNIIMHEDDDGLTLWGADDEAFDLFVSKREDLITPEWEKHREELYEKYRMR